MAARRSSTPGTKFTAICGKSRRAGSRDPAPTQLRGSTDASKLYRLVGRDGGLVLSTTPGTLGGHRRSRVYGRLDCPSALRWIAKGYYVRHRVFFADEETAVSAGYRPCAVCLPDRYRRWKARVDSAPITP